MSIMGTAVSGLLAYQRALATTSHNITNASTEGYSRQRVELHAQNPHMLGGMFIGQGVQVSTVERLQSNLVDAQLRTNLSNNASASVRAGFAENIDNILADDSTGLAPMLDNYFNAIQDVANDPTSLPARIVMLNDAESLTQRFSQLNGQFEEQRELVNGQISNTVKEINQYSKSLAELNNRIVSDYSAGSAPNDVLDARDNILNKLAEKIDVRTIEQDDGSLSVFIGNGQALVMRGSSSELVADNLSLDPKNVQIGLKTSSGSMAVNVTRFMSGGEIGGLLETRSEMLDGPQNQLGLIALNLATKFNDQHGKGFDLDGAAGGDLFTLPEVVVNSKSTNTASVSPAVTISNVSELTTSDYQLSRSATGYQMKRLPENETVSLVPDATNPAILVGDGLSIDTSAMEAATPAPAAGDTWLIQPTRFAASGLGVAITDPAKIAAAETPGQVGDNRNMLALANIQNQRTVEGKTTIQDSYGSILADVGSQTRQAQIARDSSATLLEAAQAKREAISGVNLDEEAANLLRFQQAYQASAKVISVAGEMFDTLINAVR